MMVWMAVGWLMGLALVVAAAWWLVTNLRPTGRDRALDILRERYARGEISREEYEAQRRDLAA